MLHAFHYRSSTPRQTERKRARLRPSSLWPRASAPPTHGDGEERVGGWVGGERGVGQTFPWQDPWDTAEARVQPVKERMRARQSISGSHLHNKWSSHMFSSTCSFIRSLARTPFVSVSTLGSSAHANAGSDGGWREEEEGRRAAICWSGTNSMSVSKTPEQVCGVISKCIAAKSWTLVASAFKSIPPNKNNKKYCWLFGLLNIYDIYKSIYCF